MKAREIAFKILCDIEENNNYSNIAINKHFKNLKISNQDRGLATEIVYGVVENKYYLDYVINKLSKISDTFSLAVDSSSTCSRTNPKRKSLDAWSLSSSAISTILSISSET